jgi:superfamily II DNA or RNA helicase
VFSPRDKQHNTLSCINRLMASVNKNLDNLLRGTGRTTRSGQSDTVKKGKKIPPSDKGKLIAQLSASQETSQVKFRPREDQALATDNVHQGFKQNDRGQLILPCGTGKTLTGLWIK